MKKLLCLVTSFILIFNGFAIGSPVNAMEEGTSKGVAIRYMPPSPDMYMELYGEDGADQDSKQSAARFSAPAMMNAAAPERIPVQGAVEKVLVIPISFTDAPFEAEQSTDFYKDALEDMREYYELNSQYDGSGKGLSVEATVVDAVYSDYATAYYGANNGYGYDCGGVTGDISSLAAEAVEKLEARGFDFSSFDSDDADTYIDHLMIIHSGWGEEAGLDYGSIDASDLIWSHAYQIGTTGIAVDGVKALNYTTVPADATLGTLAHEFGHDIGLPDLYNVNYGAEGVGYWDIMSFGSWNGDGNGDGRADGSNPANFSAWCREYLGWTDPVTISRDTENLFLENVSGISDVARFTTAGGSTNDYYLAEYRIFEGYDADLPGEGLLIWHVDPDWIDYKLNSNMINAYGSRMGVELVQADGDWDMRSNVNVGDDTDPFGGAGGNNNFIAIPDLLNYRRTYASNTTSTIASTQFAYVAVTNIAADGTSSTATADYYVEPNAPAAPSVTGPTEVIEVSVTPTFEWEVSPLAVSYELELSTDPAFASAISSQIFSSTSNADSYNGSGFSYTIADGAPLTKGTTYYWRVSASNGTGEVWSVVNSFTPTFDDNIAAPAITFSFDGTEAGKLMGINTDMEYSLDAGENYSKATTLDQALSAAEILQISAAKDIRVKVAETLTTLPGASTVIDILEGPEADIEANDSGNTIAGIDVSMEFSTNGSSWIRYNGSNLPSLAGNTTIYIRVAATGHTLPGAVKALEFSTAPDVSFSFSGVNAGKLLGIDSTIEYSLDGGVSYIAATTTDQLLGTSELASITAINDIRVRFVSGAGVTRVIDILTGPEAPAVDSDDEGNSLSGIDSTMEFSIDGSSWTMYSGSNLPGLTGNIRIYVRVAAAGCTLHGAAAVLEFTTAPDVSFSFSGTNAGKLMGIDTTMEYSLDGGTDYTAATAADQLMSEAEIASITAADDIMVRLVSGEGATRTIDILYGPAAPSAASNNSSNTISGIDSTMEFSTDGSTWTTYSTSGGEDNLPDLTGNITIYVRVKASGCTLPGSIKTLNFTRTTTTTGGSSGGGSGRGSSTTTTTTTAASAGVTVTGSSLNTQINNTAKNVVTIEIPQSAVEQSATIDTSIIKALSEKNKELLLNSGAVRLLLPPDAIGTVPLASAGEASQLKLSITELDASKAEEGLTSQGSNGLFMVGGRVFEFQALLISKDKTINIAGFEAPVRITIDLKGMELSGVDMEKLGVYYYNPASKEWEYKGGIYDAETGTISFKTEHFSYYAIMEYHKVFSDMEKHWAKDYIEKMAAKHIAKGENGSFKPDASISRAEFTALLVRMLELGDTADSTSSVYADVASSKWYAAEINNAAALGITVEKAGMPYRPEVEITREEIAQMLAKALQSRGISVKLSAEQVMQKLGQFSDYDQISLSAREAFAITMEKGIIKGRTVDTLAPKGNATRAEAIVMLYRLLNVK